MKVVAIYRRLPELIKELQRNDLKRSREASGEAERGL
jgi:hypothetical protein